MSDNEYSKRKTKGLNNSLERSLEQFNSTKHKKNMETHLNDRGFNDFLQIPKVIKIRMAR